MLALLTTAALGLPVLFGGSGLEGFPNIDRPLAGELGSPQDDRSTGGGPQTGAVWLEFGDGRTERLDAASFELPAEGPLEPLMVRWERLGATRSEMRESASGAAGRDERAELLLTGGERLVGRLVGGAGELLEVELVGQTRVPLAIDALLSLRFSERLGAEDAASVEPPEEGDRLYRMVGDRLDRLDGFVEAFEADGVKFESLVGIKQVPWSEVGALFIEPLGEVETAPPGPRRVAVDLVNGSRLVGSLGRADRAGLSLELAGGTAVRLPIDVVQRLSVLDGRMTYLSDLPWSVFEGGSAFGDGLGLVWSPRVDRCVEGGPLLVGEQRVPRGIGVMAPTVLEWELPEGYREFRGAACVDASVKRLGLEGSVSFRVWVDGEVRFDSQSIGVRSGAVVWPAIDVKGAKRLRLEADMGPDYNAGDRADWLDLRLIR